MTEEKQIKELTLDLPKELQLEIIEAIERYVKKRETELESI